MYLGAEVSQRLDPDPDQLTNMTRNVDLGPNPISIGWKTEKERESMPRFFCVVSFPLTSLFWDPANVIYSFLSHLTLQSCVERTCWGQWDFFPGFLPYICMSKSNIDVGRLGWCCGHGREGLGRQTNYTSIDDFYFYDGVPMFTKRTVFLSKLKYGGVWQQVL